MRWADADLRPEPNRLLDQVNRVWDLLTGPSQHIQAAEMRRRARLLAALLLILLTAAFLLTLVIPWIVAPAEHAANRILALTGLAVLAVGLVIYLISRTRFFETAAWFAVFATIASVSFSLYASQGTIWQDGAPFFLALGTILATLLLPLAAAGGVVVLCLFLPLLFYLTIPSFSAASLSEATLFLAVTSALLLITALVRHLDIEQIRAQARVVGESEERYRTLFEASFEGLALHDGRKVLEVNEAMARIWGRPRQALVGTGLFSLVTKESRPLLARSIGSTHHSTHEATGLRSNGRPFAMEFITKPYRYQGELVQVTALRDISDRKDAEAARIKAQELEAANQRLVEIDRLKTHILNVTSHELNTPITPLRMQIHLLKNTGLGVLNEKQMHSVQILDRNLDRLNRLVKDILDVSRIEAGHLHLQPEHVEITAIIQNVATTLKPEAERRRVRLDVCMWTQDWVEADPERIEQALTNLVANALNSTPPGGTVTLETRSQPHHVEIEVRDTGTGLSAAQRSRLFRPFDPVQDHHGEAHSGFGLYISKGIVEHHNGSLEVESEGLGKGCRFRVELPRHHRRARRTPDSSMDPEVPPSKMGRRPFSPLSSIPDNPVQRQNHLLGEQGK